MFHLLRVGPAVHSGREQRKSASGERESEQEGKCVFMIVCLCIYTGAQILGLVAPELKCTDMRVRLCLHDVSNTPLRGCCFC